jgi:hypothetical protein
MDRGTQGRELFFGTVIESYAGDPRFLPRAWLETAIHERLACSSERPFLLITAEPGAGKSAALAWLARQHQNWPRYFIRRNEISPLGPPGARSFLFHIGLQLAALFPAAFETKRLSITVEQRLSRVKENATVIGAEIQRLIASPFVSATIRITQELAAAGKVTGLKIDEYVAEPRMSVVSDLQYLALIDPASAIATEHPDERIVVLIDAVDELRYQPQADSLLGWLEDCPDFPANVRVVIASRPDDDLLRAFRDRQAHRIQEFPLDFHASHCREDVSFVRDRVMDDLRAYARNLAATPEVAHKLGELSLTSDEFVATAVGRADGNLGYLAAVGRAVDHFIAEKEDQSLLEALRLKDLPPGLAQLYAYFLHMVKRRAVDRSVAIVDAARGTIDRATAWTEVHVPILGLLSVATEPLEPSKIRRRALIQANDDELFIGLHDLRQFLDDINGAYRLYHSTLLEFLGDPATRDDPDTRDLYQDPILWHGRVVSSCSRAAGGWARPDWSALDAYDWRSLTRHLAAGGKALLPQLYEVVSAGFLDAKRKVSTSAAELEPDWRLILQAASDSNDLVAFLRCGYRISQQSMELSYLQLGDAAQTAINLALRRNDHRAVDRIRAELSVVEYLHARIAGQQMLLEQVLAGGRRSDVTARLIADIGALLPLLDAGPGRDAVYVRQLALLATAGEPGWGKNGAETLRTISSLQYRAQIHGLLSAEAARKGEIQAAAETFMAAVGEFRQFDLRENVVADVLQMVMPLERVEPSAELARAIDLLLPAIAAFGPETDEETLSSLVMAVREQFARLKRPNMRLQLEAKVFHNLKDGGHSGLANTVVRPVLEELIAQSAVPATPSADPREFGNSLSESAKAGAVILNLLPLVAVAAAVDHEALLGTIERLLLGHVNRISRIESLINAAQYAGAVPPFDPNAKRVAVSVLNAVEKRARQVTGGEGLFVILAVLCPGYVRCGESSHAASNLQQLVDRLPAVWPAPAEYPEQAMALDAGFQTMWTATCMIGDENLLTSVLEWLTKAVPRALDYSRVGHLWINAAGALQQIPDVEVAQRMLDRLAPRLLESRDVDQYETTATIQMADAYAELGLNQECLRLLDSPLGRGVSRWPHLAGWVASLRARHGDIEGCRKLLESTLQGIESDPGLNTRADRLINMTKGLEALASSGPAGAARAVQLSKKLLKISRNIDGGEYTLLSMAAITKALVIGNVPGPTRELADTSRRYLQRGKSVGIVGPVLHPIAVLHQASQKDLPRTRWSKFIHFFKPREAPGEAHRELLGNVEDLLFSNEPASDFDKAQLCELCARTATMRQFIGDIAGEPKWVDVAARNAAAIGEPTNRLSACCAMTQIEGIYQRTDDAARWLAAAVAAYPAIQEVYEINSAAERIVAAWESLPDPALRSQVAGQVLAVLSRLDNPELRFRLQGRVAVGLWQETGRFLEILSRFPAGSAADSVLQAIREKETVPEGIGPPVLFQCLAKCARQSRVAFAGESLTAVQAAIRREWFEHSVLISALKAIEQMMRDISPTGLGTRKP